MDVTIQMTGETTNMTKTYKRVVLPKAGDADVFTLEDAPLTDPAPDEVRVRVQTAGVAYADVHMRAGNYPGMPDFPFTPGYDVVGVVDAVGREVTDVQVGQTVAALTKFGGYAEYVNIPAWKAVPVPAGVDPAQAVALGLNYNTAYQMLHHITGVPRGGSVLMHGASGGVGTAMLEVAKLHDVTVYGTASARKHDLVRELGGVPIDYRSEDFVARVRVLTNGAGVDAAFDHIGGRHLVRSFKTVKPGGAVVTFGMYNLGGGTNLLEALSTFVNYGILKLNPRKRAYFYDVNNNLETYREDMAQLLAWLADGKINPVVSERIPLEEVSRAHRLIEDAQVQGKIVLIVSD